MLQALAYNREDKTMSSEKSTDQPAESSELSASPPSAGAVAPDVLFAEDARAAGEPPPGTVARVGLASRNLPQKTFVSLLQEIATESGRECSFQLLASEGRVHEPTFVFRAGISGLAYSGEGAGKNKKVAKHMAAKRLLEQMFADENENFALPGSETMLPRAEVLRYLHSLMPELGGLDASLADAAAAAKGDSSLPIVPPIGPAGPNPVQSLNDLVNRRKWPAINYKDGKDEGEPHERVFEIECHVGRFCESGKGKSKKQAKREAAEKMLFFLRELPAELEQELMPAITAGPENGEEEVVVSSETGKKETGQKTKKTGQTEPVAKPKRRIELLSGRNFSLETPCEEHCALLEQIVTEMKWEKPVFKPMEHRGMAVDEHYCLLEIPNNNPKDKGSILPITVHGMGESKTMARHDCAMNALYAIQVCWKEENDENEEPKK